jgi:hypothetical protein
VSHPYYTCLTCNKEFKSYQKKTNPKYCTKLCYQKRVVSSENRNNMSKARLGKTPWNKGVKMWEGKEHPRGTLGKKGLNKGRKVSEETREKLRLSHIGKGRPRKEPEHECKNCNKKFNRYTSDRIPLYCSQKCFGLSKQFKRFCVICGNRIKYNCIKFCSQKCNSIYRTGKNLSEEHKKKLIGARPHTRGENAYNYTGNKNKRLVDMGRTEYRQWRKSVFERDNYTCVHCNVRSGKYLNADHIKPYCTHPELRYDINNGRTLCLECHKKTDTYGAKLYHQLRKQKLAGGGFEPPTKRF